MLRPVWSELAREPFQDVSDSLVYPLLHPLLIVDEAGHAALGPATPDQLVRPRVNEVEQDRTCVIDVGGAVVTRAVFLVRTAEVELLGGARAPAAASRTCV